jgi:hypothetical protein
MRFGFALALAVAVPPALAAACSAFDAAPSPPLEAGAGDARAGSAEAGAPGVCEDGGRGPGHLYVVGGNALDDAGSWLGEIEQILRAEVRCDGSLGPWAVDPVVLPLTFTRGAGGVVGDTVVLVDGYRERGPPLAKSVLTAGRNDAGGLAPFETYDVPELVARWRVASATSPDALFVLGGQIENDYPVADVEAIRIENGRPVVAPQTPLPGAHSNLSAAQANGQIVAMVGEGDPYSAAAAPNGSLSPWTRLSNARRDQQMTGVADGANVYFLGGVFTPDAVTIVRLDREPVFGTAAPLARPLGESAGAATRGYVYLVSGNNLGTDVLIGRLGPAGVTDLVPGPSLPAARVGHVVFIY